MKEGKKKENRNTWKLEMVFQHRMHDFLIEKQFMHLTQGDSKIKILMLYFTNVRYLMFIPMKKEKEKENRNTCKLEIVF